MLTKELTQKLMKLPGQIRGMDLKADANFVLQNQGQEALAKVKQKLKQVGCSFEYEKLKSMDFYPGGLKAISLLAIKDVLGYDEKDIETMGQLAPKMSLIVKVFIKYFTPVSKFFFQESPKIWRKYWTVGQFIPVKFNEREKFVIVQVKDLNLHPIYCVYLKGYFFTLIQMVTGGKQITCEETKCTFRGDSYHEYLIKWK